VTDPYDRPMPGAGCPNPDCPPTEKAPIDVPESDDEAGAEPDRFTADEVAALFTMTPKDEGTDVADSTPSCALRQSQSPARRI
jgi:hypothetical protein